MQRKLTKQQLQNLVTAFNLAYKTGDKVEVMTIADDDKSTFKDTIYLRAYILNERYPVVWLQESGICEITFIVGKL